MEKTVDSFIDNEPEDIRVMLGQLRDIIRSVVPPGTEEVISYQAPCYKYEGMLVGFNVNKNGISFITMNPKMLSAYADELKGYKYSGSTIHITPKQEMPVTLLEKLIRQRVMENSERAALKETIKT
ncbi:MAG TPA: DUF1801 domain-containing protein [Mucilaginibacter sp.]|nr:DUF1801 domain-containing protein [Mucilaginibacter sp.]